MTCPVSNSHVTHVTGQLESYEYVQSNIIIILQKPQSTAIIIVFFIITIYKQIFCEAAYNFSSSTGIFLSFTFN